MILSVNLSQLKSAILGPEIVRSVPASKNNPVSKLSPREMKAHQ